MATLKNQSFKTIIFSIAIASLFCGQTSAMDNLFNKNQKEQSERIQKPLSTGLEEISIPLISTSLNTLPIVFNKQPHENFIINYLFDGACVAQLFQANEITCFESKDPKKYDFLLQSILKTGALTVATQGSFTFQKPVKTQSASLKCKSVEFLDKFLSKKDLTLDVNYCDNCSDITCADIVFRGDRFNTMSGSTLNIHGTASLLPAKSLFNDGIISCTHNALINTSLFENWGTLQTGNLHFDSGNILNEGSININDSFLGKCETFDHHGKMDVHNDCIFEKVGKFSTSQSSSWKVGGDWKGNIVHLDLEGNSVVGNSALLTVDSHAILSGPFRTPILYIESDDLITCNYTAQLFATYYIGLKAKDWMQFEGDIFKTLVQKNVQSQPSQKLEALLKAFPQRGVYLHSERSGIKKSGTILSKKGTVSLHAKKELTHTGLTNAGFGENSLISMNAASLDLQKESILKAFNTQLSAQNSIHQFGIADIKKRFVMQAPEIVIDATNQAGSFFATCNNISTTAESRITADVCSFDAQAKITHAGNLSAPEQLVMTSHDTELKKNSHTSTKTAILNAGETFDNQGNLNASEYLETHAKFVNNSGAIAAKNGHIKADRWWWNHAKGTVKVEKSLVIDALASLNTLGLIQANDLTINAAVDLNLLGAYYAKNTNINALIALNVGIYIPKIDSMDDIFTKERMWNAGVGLMSTFSPTAGLVYSLGKSLTWDVYYEQTVIHKGLELWDDAQELYKQEGTGVSDWIPLICKSKNLTMSAYQTANSAYQGYKIVCPTIDPNVPEAIKTNADKPVETNSNTPETIKTDIEKPADTNPNTTETANNETKTVPEAPSIDWRNVAFKTTSSLVSSFGPQMNRDALLDLNCGIITGINGQSNSLYNGNIGLSAFANRNNINTYGGNNVGILAAAELTVQAAGTYTSTGTATGINTTLTAHNLNISGKTKALYDLNLKAKDKANINAKIDAHKVGIQAKDAELGKESSINSHGGSTTVVAETVTSQAAIQSNVVHMKAKVVRLQDGSNISTQGSNNTIVIETKEATFEKGSSIDAHEGKATIVAEIVTSQATMQGNVVYVKADVVKLQDGSNISAQEGAKTIVIETKEATFEKGSNIDAHGGTTQVIAKTITNQAAIHGNIVHMKADVVKLQDGSNISAQEGKKTIIIEAKESLKADDGSNISGGIVAIDTPSFAGDKENTITSTDQTYINTAHMENHGTLNGTTTVNFTGNPNELKRIGAVEDLQYHGPLEKNMADKFAQGNNELLHVRKAGSVTINAGNQHVHLKDEHKMDHSFKVKTNGAMKCNKKLTSSGSIDLQPKENLDHKSIDAKDKVKLAGKNVIATPIITRTADGKNFEEHIEQVTITGNSIEVDATEKLAYVAVKTNSGKGGTTLTAGGKNVSAAVECKKHTETHSHNKKTYETKTTKDTHTTSHVCEHTSEGVVCVKSTNDTVELVGTTFDAKGGTKLDGKNGVNGYAVHDTHDHESAYKKNDSWFKQPVIKNEKSSSSIAKPVEFKGGQTPEVTSDVKIAMPFTCDAPKIILNAPSLDVQSAMNKNISVGEWEDPGYIWVDGGKPVKVDITYIPTFKGIIETPAKKIRIEETKNHAPLICKTTNKEAKITREIFDEIHINKPNKYCHLTKTASVAIALLVTMGTSGLGSSAGAMVATKLGCTSTISTAFVANGVSAGVTSLSVQFAHALVKHKGNVDAAVKDIANTKTAQQMALSFLTSGAMAGAGEGFNQFGLPAVKDARTLFERAAYAAPRQFTNAFIKTLADVAAGQNPKDAAWQNFKSFAADTVGISGASHIGHLYANGQIDFITHKGLHLGVGALQGAIRNGKKGAMAGGFGAFASETFADCFAPEMPSFDNIKALEAQLGRSLTKEEFTQNCYDQVENYRQKIASIAEYSKLAVVPFALFADLDVNIAQNTASNAIDNNFVVLPAILCLLTCADLAWSVYDIIKEYEAGGTDAALKQLGIEVGFRVVGSFAGKMVYKVGSKIYPTIKGAVKAVSKANPSLKSACKKLIIDPLVTNAEKLESRIRNCFAKDFVLITHDGIKVSVKEAQVLQRSAGKPKGGSFKKTSSTVPYTRPVVPRMTTKQATAEAKKLGFEKTNYYSSGQPVFKKGKLYISPDIDVHNGGIWKMANSPEDLLDRKIRLGTCDANLNRIGD